MSKNRHRTRSRALDPAAETGPEPGGFPEPASTSPATGAHASGTRAPSTRVLGALPVPGQEAVVRRTADGWRVGDDELPDLTCAMVLADLIAAELPTEIQPAVPAAPDTPLATSPPVAVPAGARAARRPSAAERPAMEEEAHRLRTTVGQLEHALTARIRVEQAIGVLDERHRIRPRQAFEQLRSAARNRGRRVIDIAADVVASASNPLLQLPEELSRQRSTPRHSPRHSRRVLRSE